MQALSEEAAKRIDRQEDRGEEQPHQFPASPGAPDRDSVLQERVDHLLEIVESHVGGIVAEVQNTSIAGQREGAERGRVFFGKVLEAGKKSITIKTRDSGEKVTFYVPLRKKEDGSQVPHEELSMHVASFDVGANVKVQWQWDEEKRWIRRVTRTEE